VNHARPLPAIPFPFDAAGTVRDVAEQHRFGDGELVWWQLVLRVVREQFLPALAFE